ncbi:cell wall anchor protein [Corynebacterium choanae]|uniref:Cell wall anchor protein n=1 Tax=Corynebacterium choanae TaxID=1862358 RepID=A0A3G6JA77_9CORY|nr:cell wall anchor protein [Corynebacterium choanae]AZA13808.1 hypothetical protein CCHOA_07080 [Corynebacterium choanae]
MKARTKTAGAFDIRNIIGALLGLYGILLLGTWMFIDPVDTRDSMKHEIDNLWVGLVLLGVAIGFFVWTKLAPIVVATPDTTDLD